MRCVRRDWMTILKVLTSDKLRPWVTETDRGAEMGRK